MRLYILGIENEIPRMALTSNLGASDSHRFKLRVTEQSLFDKNPHKYVTVKHILMLTRNTIVQKHFRINLSQSSEMI